MSELRELSASIAIQFLNSPEGRRGTFPHRANGYEIFLENAATPAQGLGCVIHVVVSGKGLDLDRAWFVVRH